MKAGAVLAAGLFLISITAPQTASAAAFVSPFGILPQPFKVTLVINVAPQLTAHSGIGILPSHTNKTIGTRPAGIVLGTSTSDGMVTQSELQDAINQASNALRQLIYANTGTVGQGLYATGGYINSIALASKIDQLSGTTLNNVTVSGITGLTAANIPSIDLTSKVTGILPIASGGTGTSTIPGYGQLLVGNGAGGYTTVATSTFGNGTATWGSINGTLANQTDLQTALNLKLSSTSLSGGVGISYVPATGVIANTGVLSITGTANQIAVSTSTGAVAFSIPSQFTIQNASATNLSAITAAFGGTGTTSISANGTLTTPALTISGNATTTGTAYFMGNVGIGTTSPGSLLSVAGNEFLSGSVTAAGDLNTYGILNFATTTTTGTTSLVQIGGVDFITASSTANNLSFGLRALGSQRSSGVNVPQNNVAIGTQSLYNINNSGNATFASNNVAIGNQAGISVGLGWNNIAIGNQALTGFTTGTSYSPNNNVAIGNQSLYRITSGGANTCIGTTSCLSVTTGSSNFGFGSSALLNNNTGSYNSALGNSALYGLTGGKSYTIGLGYDVGHNTNASGDILIGNQVDAGSLTTDNQLNIGNFLYASSIGSSTVAWNGLSGVGTSSPFARFSIQANNGDTATTLFAVGSSTASATTTLFSISNTGNVAIATTTTTGESLTVNGSISFGGANAGASTNNFSQARIGHYGGSGNDFIQAGKNNQFQIWNSNSSAIASFGTQGSATDQTTRLWGNVGIGNAVGTTGVLEITGVSSGRYNIYTSNSANAYGVYATMSNSGGVAVYGNNSANTATGALGYSTYGVYCVSGLCGGANAWNSDIRLKQGIGTLSDTLTSTSSALTQLMKLRPVSYHWKDARQDSIEGEKFGFIAQEVQQIFPNAVINTHTPKEITLADGSTTTIPDVLALDYTDFIPLTVLGVQDLNTRTAAFSSATSTAQVFVGSNGNVGIRTTNPTTRLTVGWVPTTQNGMNLLPSSDTYSNAPLIFNNSSGGLAGYISQTANSVAYNTTSDRRLKENIATTTAGLTTLLSIPVDDFNFISDPSKKTVQGFIAQDLYKYYPEAVTANGDNGVVPLGATSTPWAVDYGRLTPLIVQAVKDIATLSDTFKQTLIAWFADSSNGITDFFAGNLHATNELCVGNTCVTPAQFQAMVAATGQANTASSGSSPNIQISAPTPLTISGASGTSTSTIQISVASAPTISGTSTAPEATDIKTATSTNPVLTQAANISSSNSDTSAASTTAATSTQL